MLVDDEKDFTFTVRKILEKEGFEVVEAHSGEECLKKVKKAKPDLMLLDIMMPNMDGWEVSKRIKEDSALNSIPIIMLTVKFQRDAKLKSFQYAACDGYISKPINRDKLLKAIHWVMGEPYVDTRRVPSKCGIDCRICDQFVYEICRGCLKDMKDSCIVSECTMDREVNTCFECIKIDYCKKRKEAVEGCIVFNPSREVKKNFVYLVGQEEEEEGNKIFSREVFEGAKGLIFSLDKKNANDAGDVEVSSLSDIDSVSEEIDRFIGKNQNSVILIESLAKISEDRSFTDILRFTEELHNLSLEKDVRFFVFVRDFDTELRNQLFNFLASLQIEAIIKSISNPQRKDILDILKMAGKSTFTEMLQALGYSTPSKLSFHLKVLKQVRIIDQDNKGTYYLTDTGRKLDELLYKMRDTVFSALSVTPDFKITSAGGPINDAELKAYNRYIKAAEKAGFSKVTDILDEFKESLPVLFGADETQRIVLALLDEYISSERMLNDEDLKKKISELAFVYLSEVMPVEDAIDWAEKLIIKYSLK